MKLMNSFCKILARMSLGLFVSQTAFADGFRNPPDTSAALGKSGANIVWVDDASALFYNPANLVDVPSREVQLSILTGYSHVDYDGQLGETETDHPWSLLPTVAFAWPLRETEVALGLGLHVPYGRETHWDNNGSFRYAAPVCSKMMVMDLAPTVAWQLSEAISIGAGLDLYYGRLQFRQWTGPESRITADANGTAVGANVGFTWRITPNQRLALTCHSPFDISFEGDLETINMPPPAVDSSSVESTFKFPTIVALGYGLKLSKNVRVEANVEWLQYSRYETMNINAGDNKPLVSMIGLERIPQNWDDTWTFGIGADWRFAPDWTLRVGYIYLQSPIPDNTFSPMALDVDQSMISMGLGYQTGRHTLDLAYALGLFATRRINNNQNPLYQQGEYDFEGHLAALTYTYAF